MYLHVFTCVCVCFLLALFPFLALRGTQKGADLQWRCRDDRVNLEFNNLEAMWVVVKIMAPFWVLSIIRHLVFRGPKGGPKF